jgi:phosphoenolpyruvate-protein phosphotransferase (PTS system enzyme I)
MHEDLAGLGVSAGLAVGPVVRMPEVELSPVGVSATVTATFDPATEQARVTAALEAVAVDLEALAETAAAEARGVLQAEAMMARDPGLSDDIVRRVGEGDPAAAAVDAAVSVYREMLASAGEYMAARVHDLDAVRDRVLANLAGVEVARVPDPGHPFVLVARDLAPAETATLRPELVLALVTEEGGPTSHTAIIAKSLGVPAVVACAGATDLADGTKVIVDGGAGTVIVDPDEEQVAAAQARAARRAAARRVTSGPGQTKDGYKVKLLANIGGPKDVASAVEANAEGVGLFRTEFLFLDRPDPPSVSEQEEVYTEVLAAFPEGRVVLRTLDAGADKPLPFLDLGDEPNPALGQRGLRAVRLWPEILRDQLDAIGRAAARSSAETWVMAPMVATAEEAGWFCGQARRQPIDKAGVMVELPAAALTADAILAEADFASLGTNDLAQYTFGADRMVSGLASLQDSWQPALLRLVSMTADAGERADRPVGVCGEAASDPVLALVLVGLGVKSLSMAATSMADVRTLLGGHTLEECRRLAQIALNAPDAKTGRDQVRAEVPAVEELGL